MAVLHWSEDEFWSSTPYALFAAIEAHNRMNGAEEEPDPDFLAWVEEERRKDALENGND